MDELFESIGHEIDDAFVMRDWLNKGGDPNMAHSLLGSCLKNGNSREHVESLLDAGAELTAYEMQHLFPFTLWSERAARELFPINRSVNENALAVALDYLGAEIDERAIDAAIERGAKVNHPARGNVSPISIFLHQHYAHIGADDNYFNKINSIVNALMRHGAVYTRNINFSKGAGVLERSIERNDKVIFNLVLTSFNPDNKEDTDIIDKVLEEYPDPHAPLYKKLLTFRCQFIDVGTAILIISAEIE